MRVLYLYSGSRGGVLEKAKTGETHRNGFWGMTYLPEYGIESGYLEIEQFAPARIARFIRRIVNVYFIHLPFLWRMRSYDIVFTSAAFGTQFFHTLFGFKKPIWVMHDFSITGLLGNEKTVRQKLFRSMVEKSGGIVTLSATEKKRLEKRFPQLEGKIEFIPFGVDMEFFAPYEIREENQILAVGFDPDRDWETLIAAVEGLSAKIVLATRMDRVAHLSPLPENIEVRRFSAKELVREYLRSAVVVIPLDVSGHNNDAMGCSALFEAMALGRSVVATRTETMESYINDGQNGFLVREKNSYEMRIAIETLLKDASLRKRIGENAIQYAREHLDARKCAGKLAGFFRRVATIKENVPTPKSNFS